MTSQTCSASATRAKHTAAGAKHTAARAKHTAARAKHTAARAKHTAARAKHGAASAKHGAAKHTAAGECAFVLTDGRRFRCSGSAFSRSTPSADVLARSRACVALGRLAIPAGSRAVAAALGNARACLTRHGLPVIGGPVPPGVPSSSRPDGELIVGSATNQAFVAFYHDPVKATRLEPAVIQSARGAGGQVQRRGAVMIVWAQAPPSALRSVVQACVFVS